MIRPSWLAVFALKFLQKSMMLTPCGPSAVPTGGAGVAEPACSCTLTSAAIFFLGGIAFFFLLLWSRRGRTPSATGCRYFIVASVRPLGKSSPPGWVSRRVDLFARQDPELRS